MSVSVLEAVRLSELKPGQGGLVVSLDSGDAGRLRKLLALGVVPGSQLAVQQRRPAYVVRVGRTQLALDAHLAEGIRIRLER